MGAFDSQGPSGEERRTLSGQQLLGGAYHPFHSRLHLLPHTGEVWVPICRASQVPPGTLRRERVVGLDIVVFHLEDGQIGAVLDRCPHRGVPLSLGRCVRGGVQCEYHGLVVNAEGRCGPLEVASFVVRQHLGLIWFFVGEPFRADHVTLPDFAPFGTGRGLDMLLDLDIDTHWSMVLDNGLDLSHDHLHRSLTFFFRTAGLREVWLEGDHIHVAYTAEMRDEFNRRRKGAIALDVTGNTLRLDFEGQPIIHSVLTPRAANGRAVTQWWFVTFQSPSWARGLYALALPFVRSIMLEAFAQDKLMLEAECKAVFEEGVTRYERNPAVLMAHAHLVKRTVAYCRAHLSLLPRVEVLVEDLLDGVKRGVLGVVDTLGGEDAILTWEELVRRVPSGGRIEVHRYWQMVLLT